jgi:hypothetical protein
MVGLLSTSDAFDGGSFHRQGGDVPADECLEAGDVGLGRHLGAQGDVGEDPGS